MTDENYSLRHNPLGIHSLDGTDFVIGKAPRHSPVKMNTESESVGMKAKNSYFDQQANESFAESFTEGEADSNLPVEDQLASLGISSAPVAPPTPASGHSIVLNTNTSAPKDYSHNSAVHPSSALDSSTVPALSLNSSPITPPLNTATSTTTTTPTTTTTTTSSVEAEAETENKTEAEAEAQTSSAEPLSPLNDQFNLDFGSDLGNEMSSMLTRKNTIASRTVPKSVSQPVNLTYSKSTSKTPFLAQRLKSIRKRIPSREMREIQIADEDDDLKRAEELPDYTRDMMAFSPSSTWLESDSEGDENAGELNRSLNNGSGRQALANSASVPAGIHNELNPFLAPHRNFNELSPSVSTLSSVVSADEDIFGVNQNANERNSGVVEEESAKKHQHAKPLTIDQLDPVQEDDRGRLFLQIDKIANLRGLPIDTARKPKFTLSLDNGLQTVTTEPSKLPGTGMNGSISARIGQEFELTVAKDLELVLTVNVSMEALEPPARPVAPQFNRTHEPTMSTASATTNGSTGSAASTKSDVSQSPVKKNLKNLLLSPKKKRQQQMQNQQVQAQAQAQAQAPASPTKAAKLTKEDEERQARQKRIEESHAREQEQHRRDMQEFHRRSDMWRGITGSHGEYCRGYVFASHYEKDIYGVAKSFAIPLYNEWDTKATTNGTTNPVPKPVCDLNITMMYVPKLYGSEQVPMSLFECQQALAEARTKQQKDIEGFLTQQGGDCGNIWRRRYFNLHGSELISQHEATRKRKALIHLENVVNVSEKLSDDLWCIYEDRSFQLNFDDGDSIGFYADTVEARNTWIKSLREAVANSTGQHRTWTDLVLEAQK